MSVCFVVCAHVSRACVFMLFAQREYIVWVVECVTQRYMRQLVRVFVGLLASAALLVLVGFGFALEMRACC